MIRFQKKPILTLATEPTYIRHEAKGKHNEVTVVVARYAIPLKYTFYHKDNSLSRSILNAGIKATRSFQDIEFEFNGIAQAPAFTFVVKAKTERRGDDPHDQKLADKIALVKANIKACAIARKVFLAMAAQYCNELSFNHSIYETLSNYEARETSYLNNICLEFKDKASNTLDL